MAIAVLLDYDKAILKRCAKCKKILPRECFYKNRSNPDGLNTYCKECQNKVVQNVITLKIQ